ncbi:hypothetical protein DFQ26_004452 [Actinomortierella ambigua]|nr:hypothetical protein DFQ26_004452 [Actinomortierella ambigua]
MASEASVELGAFLGSGAYGSVYYGRWAARRVAIKMFNVNKNEANMMAEIQKEVDLLERLQCRYIIQFYGKTYYQENLVLVMDYADGGSLGGAIQKKVLDWQAKFRIAQEIAAGLAYIHHLEILHRDLKSANVLLTKFMEVRLADFGLAMVKSTSASKSTGDKLKGTPRWMAPELFFRKPKYSTKSDMYALGMVMWEMAANSTTPFSDQPSNIAAVAIVQGGGREDLPDDTPAHYREWVERCWEQDPLERPEAFEMAAEDDEPVKAGSDATNGGGSTVQLSADVLGFSISLPPNVVIRSERGAANLESDDFDAVLRRAEDGDVEAQLAVAVMYSNGTGVKKSDSEALHWYWQAAKQGHIEGEYRVGYHCSIGLGTTENFGLALEWLRKAAAKGHAGAEYIIGCMYMGGEGVEESTTDAYVWFQKAASQNHPRAQNAIGRMYYLGDGLEQDFSKAKEWLEKSAAQNYAPALTNLGELYKDGPEGLQDDRLALTFFQQAADQGESIGQYNIGWMYDHGRGVEKDMEQAKFWYTKAAKQLDPHAMRRLKELEEADKPKGFLRRIAGWAIPQSV